MCMLVNSFCIRVFDLRNTYMYEYTAYITCIPYEYLGLQYFCAFFYCQLSIILQITKVLVIRLGSDISFAVYLNSQYNFTPGLCIPGRVDITPNYHMPFTTSTN